VDDDKPELRPTMLANPVLNQLYDELILVSIRNEPFDDSLIGTDNLFNNTNGLCQTTDTRNYIWNIQIT